MSHYKTVNRGKLYRAALKGKLEVKCTNRLTDDYAGDAADNFGRTDWMPAIIDEAPGARHEGYYVLAARHFKGKGGFAYTDGDNDIRLVVYQGYSFDVRITA